MHTDDEIKQIVMNFLKEKGFVPQEIPPSVTRTPDLLVTFEHKSILNFWCKKPERVIIEIKTKENFETKEYNRNELLKSGEVVIELDLIKRMNRYSNIIRDKVDQLRQYTEVSDYRIIWIQCTGTDALLHFKMFEQSLYGKKTAIGISEDNDIESRDCFFCDHSDFYRYKSILDGAVLQINEAAYLLINSFSSKYLKFINSKFVNIFRKAIIDPVQLDKDESIFLADFEADRNNLEEVGLRLAKKYKYERMPLLDLTQYSASVLFSKNPKY